MCIFVFAYLRECMHMRLCMRMYYVCAVLYVYVYVYVYVHVCEHLCTCMRMCTCECACVISLWVYMGMRMQDIRSDLWKHQRAVVCIPVYARACLSAHWSLSPKCVHVDACVCVKILRTASAYLSIILTLTQ
jgi:hypothetical protein